MLIIIFAKSMATFCLIINSIPSIVDIPSLSKIANNFL
ncbi:hypothetical protein A0H76_3008 [Hepatospora eriocheir]|uniref:Uncharacterized protein n=1 Tax=Hepatospora eriocheir TaxID=1081669 RepID=A0A1X0QKT1_9MICR|nr:hypothetical protein A0H76_3008 [Hepatospora eriocheir]